MPERAPGVLQDQVDGRAVLVDPSGAHVIELNAVGTLVWGLLDGDRDVDALVDGVLAAVEDELPRAQVEQDVRTFLAELERLTLLAP